MVITDILMMNAKSADGHLRFLCPVCRDFHTATKSDTNLGRCFRCKRNYNSVDLMMIVNNWDFVKTVNVLKNYLVKE
jgi:hypothetical protein